MNRYSAVIMLTVLSTGCMHETKPQTQPPPVAATPETPKAPQTAKATPATAKPPSSTSKAPATTSKAKPSPATTAKTAPTSATKPQPATPQKQVASAAPPKQASAPAPPKQAAAAPTLDVTSLEARLKQTKAIGLMTKLSLKNKVDDLLDQFRQHHAGKPMPTVSELRRSYDLLMMKVLSLLQDRDQQLASDILTSRERIWGLLADPKSFAALQAE
jgi:hypothetical protein